MNVNMPPAAHLVSISHDMKIEQL